MTWKRSYFSSKSSTVDWENLSTPVRKLRGMDRPACPSLLGFSIASVEDFHAWQLMLHSQTCTYHTSSFPDITTPDLHNTMGWTWALCVSRQQNTIPSLDNILKFISMFFACVRLCTCAGAHTPLCMCRGQGTTCELVSLLQSSGTLDELRQLGLVVRTFSFWDISLARDMHFWWNEMPILQILKVIHLTPAVLSSWSRERLWLKSYELGRKSTWIPADCPLISMCACSNAHTTSITTYNKKI